MQLGDSTRVHCKNNIRNTIEKVNSSQFWFWWTFSEVIEYIIGHLFCPKMCNYSWSLHLDCIPSIVLFQVTDFWRAYDTISRELGLRWLKVTPTTSDVFLVDTKGSITPKNSKMVGIYDENVNIYILSITKDSDTNIILRQIVGICSSTCKLFITNCISQIFFLAKGFHLNNAENVHSVAKRDARKVSILYSIVMYSILYIP